MTVGFFRNLRKWEIAKAFQVNDDYESDDDNVNDVNDSTDIKLFESNMEIKGKLVVFVAQHQNL